MPDYVSITCGYCEQGVAAVVVFGSAVDGYAGWLTCPACSGPSVRTGGGAVYPSSPAGSPVANLPLDVKQAWQEARTSLAVGAFTASEMMCRKILMHLAVDVAKSPPGKNFTEYVSALDKAGYVVQGLKDVVDQVRQRGNVANHDLPSSTQEEALTTLKITEYLLRGAYELPGLAPSSASS